MSGSGEGPDRTALVQGTVLIGVGTLVWLLDVTLGPVDVLHDPLGLALILIGVVLTETVSSDSAFADRMRVAKIGSASALVLGVLVEPLPGVRLLPQTGADLLTVVGLAAAVVSVHAFGLAMERLALTRGADETAKRWGRAVWLLIVLVEVPLLAVYALLLVIGAIQGAVTFHEETVLALPLFLLLGVAVLSLFHAMLGTVRGVGPQGEPEATA